MPTRLLLVRHPLTVVDLVPGSLVEREGGPPAAITVDAGIRDRLEQQPGSVVTQVVNVALPQEAEVAILHDITCQRSIAEQRACISECPREGEEHPCLQLRAPGTRLVADAQSTGIDTLVASFPTAASARDGAQAILDAADSALGQGEFDGAQKLLKAASKA